MSDPIRIPAAVAKKLGNYVYLYIDPRDGKPIYVGKGRGARVLAHLKGDKRKQLTSTVREIRRAGLEPKLEILSHNLPSEETALQVECAVIDALYAFDLANKVRGWGSREAGRASLKELIARYTGKRFKCKEPAILIRINRLYRPDMTAVELYDATRSAWKVGERRRGVKYAMAVYNGVIREVYTDLQWLPGGSTFNTLRKGSPPRKSDRKEFVGRVAEERVRRRFINAYVGDRFKQGSANPIAYVNC